MGQTASLLCVVTLAVPLHGASRRVVRNINDEALDLSYVEVDGHGWRNDYDEDYWIAKVADGMVSMMPHDELASRGESIGTPYDEHRVFNLYGAWSDSVPDAASSYIEHDKLFTTLQLYGAEYYHMHVETLPKLVLGKKLLEAEPSLKILMYRPKPYAKRFLQLLEVPDASLVFALTNPAKNGDTACGLEGRCVDFKARTLFIPSPAHQFSPSGQAREHPSPWREHPLPPPPPPPPQPVTTFAHPEGRQSRHRPELPAPAPIAPRCSARRETLCTRC